MNIGERLKHERTQRNWSLSELARQSGVSRGYLHLIECGNANPTQEKLAAIAATLGLSTSALIGEIAIDGELTDTEYNLLMSWRMGNYTNVIQMAIDEIKAGES